VKAPVPGDQPLPPRQRRPGYVALAVLLIVGFAAVGTYLYGRAGAKTPVVVVVADVPAGHVIHRGDVSAVAVAGAVTAIAANHLDSVVGQTAAVRLLPGMLLQRSMVAQGAGLPADVAQVGVAVRPGQVPADGLIPGDTVEVVGLPATGTVAAASAPQVLVGQARVFACRDNPSQAGGTLLTLLVPMAQATRVAAAAATGQVVLIKVAS
jgi:SAF domain